MKFSVGFFLYCAFFSTLFGFFCVFISEDTTMTSPYSLYMSRRRALQDVSVIKASGWSHSNKLNQDCPKIPLSLVKYVSRNHSDPLTDLEKVLAMCKQQKIISPASFFTDVMQATLTKIGEGAFVDVFGCLNEDWERLAIKIIPIEGHERYNHESEQSTLKSIQTEIVVSLELSMLGDESRKMDKGVLHFTKNFMQVKKVGLCKGEYPDFMMKAWLDYEYTNKKSRNDSPDMLPKNQLYVIFSSEHCGVPVGNYVYHSFGEAISILQQVSATIAVGEAALQFEHRDLHRGNVLVRRTEQEYIYFRLDGVEYSIKSYGVMATIVDYTFSRVTQEGTECTSYVNLTKFPWLFGKDRDIQSMTYANMINHTESQWEKFYPYTNVLWLNYQATRVRDNSYMKVKHYKNWRSRLETYRSRILDCDSGKDVFLKVFSPQAIEVLKKLPTPNVPTDGILELQFF